jgi:hypothetical protein
LNQTHRALIASVQAGTVFAWLPLRDHPLSSGSGLGVGSISRSALSYIDQFASTQGFDMVQIVLIFCLAASPGSCREERPVVEQLSLTSCMVQGQQIAQDWLADHPKWTLSRWRCEQNVPRERPT